MLWKLLRPQREKVYKVGNQYELEVSSCGEQENLWNMIVGKPLVSNHLEDQDKIGRRH